MLKSDNECKAPPVTYSSVGLDKRWQSDWGRAPNILSSSALSLDYPSTVRQKFPLHHQYHLYRTRGTKVINRLCVVTLQCTNNLTQYTHANMPHTLTYQMNSSLGLPPPRTHTEAWPRGGLQYRRELFLLLWVSAVVGSTRD